MKRKTLIPFAVATVLVSAGVLLLGLAKQGALRLSGSGNEQWNHYSAVAATYDTNGVKEYWVSCETHNHQFAAPDVDPSKITDKGAPSQAWIDSLPLSDDRLLPKTRQVISFENGSDINLIGSRRNNFATKTVVTEDATDGTHCLKLTYKDGTADATLPLEYFDLVFSDPHVVAVNFDVRGNYARPQFQYYENGSGKVYEARTDEGFGLTTEWKTFSWTRAQYDTYKAGTFSQQAFLWISIAANTGEIYLDNIRPVTEALDYRGFECLRMVERSTGSDFVRKASIRDTSNAEVFAMISTVETDYGYDYANKSEGNRSIKMHKNSGANVQIAPVGEWQKMADDDILSFDLYTTVTFNSNPTTKGIRTGTGDPLGTEPQYQHKKDHWVTYRFKKTDFNSWGMALELTGSPECDVYVDNIVLSKEGDNEMGFEVNRISKTSNTAQSWNISGTKDYNVSGTNTNKEDFVLRVNGDNSLGYIGFSKTQKSEGNQSLLMTRINSSGWTQLSISEPMLSRLGANGVFYFDLYSTVGANSKSSVNNLADGNGGLLTGQDYYHPAYEWKTYGLTAPQMTSNGRFLQIKGSTLGDWYIDNLRIIETGDTEYSNGKIIYIGPSTPEKVFATHHHIDSLVSVTVGGNSGSGTILGDHSVSLENASFTSDGQQQVIIKYISGNVLYTEIVHVEVYRLTSSAGTQTVSAAYGTNDYLTISSSSKFYRIMYGEHEIPFEIDGSNYLIPTASLIQFLPEERGHKVSGTMQLSMIGLSAKQYCNVTINLTGDTTVVPLEQFAGEGIQTYAYSSFSSYADYRTYADYITEDTIREFDNTGLDYMYLQTCALGAEHSGLQAAHQYILSQAEAVGQKVMIIDRALGNLAKQTTSLIGATIDISDSSTPYNVTFNSTAELDTYVLQRMRILTSSPTIYGTQISDEPTYAMLDGGFKDLMPSVRRALTTLGRNDFQIHLNLLPMTAGRTRLTGYGSSDTSISESYYATYLDKYMEVIGNDYDFLQFDMYPLADNTKKNDIFGWTGSTLNKQATGLNNYWFQNILIAAKYCKNHGKDLRIVTQTVTYGSTGNRILSASDFAFLNNTALAMGAKNISYFVYQTRKNAISGSESWYDTQEFISAEGNRNDTYYLMTGMLAQIHGAQHVLSSFDLDHVHLYSGSSKSAAKIYTYMSGSSYYDSASSYQQVTGLSVSSDWVLFTGLKNKSSNQRLYALQNAYNHFSDNLLQTDTLTFNSTYQYAVIYEAGSPRVVKLNNNSLQLKLSAGNAAYLLLY